MPAGPFDEVWRAELPHVVATLTRRYGSFEDCEDAAQRSLIAAAEQWPRDGLPRDPRAWLLRVASRRLVDQLRQDTSRRAREDAVAHRHGADHQPTDPTTDRDDTLQLMLLCCHPCCRRPRRSP